MNKEIVLLIVLLAVVLAIVGYSWHQDQQIRLANIPPEAPTDLIGQPLSAIKMKLTWRDTSNNEDGFHLYRDGSLIAAIPKNTKEYVDGGLRPATSYRYEVEAYNQSGESGKVICFAKTLNPPIVVWIDKVGVHNNGEERELFREFGPGEIYIGLVVTDGKITVKNRLPNKDFYHLKRDEVIGVAVKAFYTEEVGEYIRLVIIGYEDDGGFSEQLIYKALDIVTKSYIGGPISVLLTLSGVSFAKIYGEICGAEDDWLGTYTAEWTTNNKWGVGEYADVECKTENGDVGLRLWLRVECPVYDYSSEKTGSQ